MQTTRAFSKLLAAYVDPKIRIILMRGGTRSSKTWSEIQLCNLIASKSTTPRLISVVSETMPHLKRGAIRDFETMLKAENLYDRDAWHDTDKIYTYPKAELEFFSADQPSKVHGPSRHILLANEIINWDFEVFRQLEVRTTEKIIADYNPVFDFWADTKLIPRSDVCVIDSTYLDNDMLSASQVASIEQNRDTDPEWWKIYGEGKKGNHAALVIRNWDIAELPPRSEWKEWYIGIDFGWSAPSAVMLVVLSKGEVWIDELAYGPNMENPDMADAIKSEGYRGVEAICDKADPLRIKDLRGLGINAKPSENKEVKLGLQIMNRYKKHYTPRSLNSIDENRKYRYPQLPEGGYGDIPLKKNGHAKDAERYVFLNRLSHIQSGFDVTVGTAGKK